MVPMPCRKRGSPAAPEVSIELTLAALETAFLPKDSDMTLNLYSAQGGAGDVHDQYTNPPNEEWESESA